MTVIVTIGDIGLLAKPYFERLVLGFEFFQFTGQIILVDGCPGGIQVDGSHDAVILIGLDNGNGLLAIADEIGEGEIGPGDDGLAGGGLLVAVAFELISCQD